MSAQRTHVHGLMQRAHLYCLRSETEACISKFESWSRLCRRCSVDGLFYRSEKVAAGSEARRCVNCGYRGRPQAGVPKSRQAAPQSCNVVGLRHLLCEGCDQRTLGYGPGAVAKHPRLCGVCKCKRRPRYKKRGRKLSDLRVAMPGVTKGCLPSSGVLVGRRVVTARSRPDSVEIIKLIPNSWSRSVQMATSWPTMLAADFVQEQVSKPEMTSLIYTARKGTQVVRVGFKRPLAKVGTIRCCAATHLAPVVLTERTKYDLPACLKFARVHRLGVGRAWVHRTVVSPSFAEYLCGLPEGWTSVEPLRLSQSTLKMWRSPEETRRTVLDVFSGCLGLHLGLREYFRTVAYVEHDPPTCEVIRARMKDGVVDRAPLLGDVRAVRALDLPELPDGLCAGFPCRDVSSAGCKQGFGGLESVLFREVARLIDEIISIDMGKARWVLLENVAGITHRVMEPVWREILTTLAERKFRATWARISASNVGCFMTRSRWFLLAIRTGAPTIDFPRITLQDLAFMRATPWNKYWDAAPSPKKWMLPKHCYDSKCAARLCMCGSTVVPVQAEVAMRILSSVDL